MSETAQQAGEPSSSSKLISATALMAAGTMLSRIVGFVRVALIAVVLGNGSRQVDMFTLANTIPNSIYILLAGGALNTVLVPQIVRAVKHDNDRGEAYTNRIMTAFLMILATVTAAATLLAPFIIELYSNASWRNPAIEAQYNSMVVLAYLCLPQIFFYGAFFLAGQVLNSRERFGPMMFAPAANNVVSILIFVLYLVFWGKGDGVSAFTDTQELVLGLGATLGIAVQSAVLVPYLRKAGFHYRPRFDFKNTGLGKTFRLAKWTLGFVIVTQAALVVVSKLATGATAGGDGAGMTVYNNAYLLWILPHSLVTVSLATAMLPTASRLAATGDLRGVRIEATRTMRLAVTALVPAAVAFLALAQPISMLLFGNGRGAPDAPYIGWALMAFAVGLVPFTLQYICLRAFYALEDTKITFFLQLVISATNIALALLIVVPLGMPKFVAAGLGLSYSGAYIVGLLISFRFLGRRLPGLSGREIVRHCVRLLVAVLPGGIAAALICWGFTYWSTTQPARALSVVVAGLVAVGLFLLLARLLHIDEVNDIMRTLLRRGSRSESGPDSASNPVGSGGSMAETLTSSPTIEAGSLDNRLDGKGAVTTMTDTGPCMTNAQQDEASLQTSGADSSRGGSAASATPGPSIPAGTLLANRYRLEELLADTQTTLTWRAFDQVLSRSVLVHLLPPGDDRAPDLLAAARRAAVATDSRFLRVLDAIHSEDPEIGSYIVCEYATGQSLEFVLASGPLSGLEAAWVVREVADAMSGMHVQGLFHERINPDTIIITPTGNVKIVGLLIEAQLRPPVGSAVHGADSPEAIDTLDLGRLLYATLVARWPGGPAFGLADAPENGHRWATPRQVRAGVSPALDRVCDQILGQPPRHRAELITSANGVVNALTKVLGPADASADLERRLRQPVPTVGGTDPLKQPVSPFLDQPTEEMAAVDLPPQRPGELAYGSQPRMPVPVVGQHKTQVRLPTGSPSSVATPRSAQTAPTRAAAPLPPGPKSAPAKTRRSRRLIVLAVVVLLCALVGGGFGLFMSGRLQGALPGNNATSGGPTPSVPPTPVKLTIESAQDFDPQGDPPNVENPDEVKFAYDGDLETRWRTVQYIGNPKLGNIKRGVGLVLDLGEARTVSSVKLALSGTGTTVEIRVPKQAPETTSKPPMNTDDGWQKVAEQSGAGTTADLLLATPVSTRFVLVYLTSLPREGSQYRGGVYEAEVFE